MKLLSDQWVLTLEDYSANYDFFVVRASNFLHNQMNWQHALDVLGRVKLPVYAIGVGAQASDRSVYRLTGDNLRFWQIVSERSRVIGVRGTFTADVLAASGIHNVEIVGCPSMFRNRLRELTIRKPAAINRLAFSMRRETSAAYARDALRFRERQRTLMLQAARHFDISVSIHGEREEKAYYYGDEAAITRARQILRRERWFMPDTEAEMERIYRDKLFFFLKVRDYDQFIRQQDFAIGYRVHGVLPALANGVPSVMVNYDSRTSELADTHAIPSIPAHLLQNINLRAVLDSVDFSDFNRVHRWRYDKLKFVLEANGLPHRLL